MTQFIDMYLIASIFIMLVVERINIQILRTVNSDDVEINKVENKWK